jgi:hypothetical protein
MPASLRLPPGISEEQLLAAVAASGYPVEEIAASIIRRALPENTLSYVEREWPFVDRDTQELRSIDVHCEWGLWDPSREAQPRVRPGAHLIVECKRSELPYVFFVDEYRRNSLDFPRMSGLHHDTLTVHTDDSLSTWQFSIPHALGLDRHSFATGPECCSVFARVERSGKQLNLSNANPFQSLVQPMIKASEYLVGLSRPGKGVWYFDARPVLAIGVLDAPMIGVRGPFDSPSLESMRWVRLMRHEPGGGVREDRVVTIDLITLEFLPEFLEDHVRPFLADYAQAVKRTQDVLLEGVGFSRGLGAWKMPDAESLRPLDRKARLRRGRKIVAAVLRLGRSGHSDDPHS